MFMEELKKILKLTAGMGELLLACGAEISRVEDTMNRVALHYGVTRRQIFIISNGVFVNLEKGEEAKNVSIRHVPAVNANINKVCEINSLSRSIEKENLSLDEALDRYEEIKNRRDVSVAVQIIASGFGAAAFCYLFGGGLRDCAIALAMGFVLGVFMMALRDRNFSKVLKHIIGSFITSAGCALLFRAGMVQNLNPTIMGSVMPLIPGVAFTNGIRDIADGDYISGGIRLLDALLTFICIAAGMCIALRIFNMGVQL